MLSTLTKDSTFFYCANQPANIIRQSDINGDTTLSVMKKVSQSVPLKFTNC